MEEMEQKKLYDAASRKISILEVIVQPEDYSKSCKQIAKLLTDAGDYLDAPALAEEYRNKAKEYLKKANMQKYERAEEILQNAKKVSDYDRGIHMLKELGDYSDAKEKAESYRKKKLEHIKRDNIAMALRVILALTVVAGIAFGMKTFMNRRAEATIEPEETETAVSPEEWEKGDKVYFGSFKWKVIDVTDEEAVLIAIESDKYDELTDVAFHDADAAVTWDRSALRAWLNGAFYEENFSDSEKELILCKTLKNEENSVYHTAGCEDTEDYVSVFSEQEVNDYFDQIKSFALNWLLRTPGNAENTVMYMSHEHQIRTYGTLVTDTMCIRPVIHVSRM